MNICRHHDIELWDVTQQESIYFSVSAKKFRKLIPFSAKTGVRPHIVRKRGFPFWVLEWRRRWTFYTGFLLFLFLLHFLSSFVWEITYTGQSGYSKDTLSDTVEQMDVYAGMRRSRLNCDAIEKKIREVHPDISWVSAEEMGSVLKISIKEGKKVVVHEKSSGAVHQVAKYDGTVQSIQVNRGVPAVKKGKKVKRGDVLISGVVPITDDSDTVVENMPVAAKGKVTLLVEKSFQEVIPLEYQKKEYTGKEIIQYRCILGDQVFYIKKPWKQFDKSYKYDIINSVCVDRKIHPFSFTLFMEKGVYREYRLKKATYTKPELKQVGLKKYRHILQEYKQDGMKLLDHTARLTQKDKDHWLLQGQLRFLCENMDTRAVSESECQTEKKDGGENGGSGNRS